MGRIKRTFKIKTNKREFVKTIEISNYYSEHGYPDYENLENVVRHEEDTILTDLGSDLKINEHICTYELIIICPGCKLEITRTTVPAPEYSRQMIENMMNGNEGYCPRCDDYIEYNK